MVAGRRILYEPIDNLHPFKLETFQKLIMNLIFEQKVLKLLKDRMKYTKTQYNNQTRTQKNVLQHKRKQI